MFGVFWPFTCHRDLSAQSCCFRDIFVILDFFFFFSRLELSSYFGQLRDFGGKFFFFPDILWFWRYFGGFGFIMVIQVISKFFFCQKIYFIRKNFQNMKKSINTPKRLR